MKCDLVVYINTSIVTYESQAGLPDGVLNFVSMAPGDAPSLTAEIIAHPAVRKVNVRPIFISICR